MFSLGRLKRINSCLGCRNRLCDFDDFRKNSAPLVFYYAPVIDECAYAKPLIFAAATLKEVLLSFSNPRNVANPNLHCSVIYTRGKILPYMALLNFEWVV